VGSYLLTFVVAAGGTALFMPLLTLLAHRVGALDNTRDPPVPRVGGPAIALGGVISLALLAALVTPAAYTLLGTSRSLGPALLGSAVILLLGVIDDVHPLRAAPKLAIQVMVAVGMYLLGVRIEVLSLPFGAIDLGTGLGLPITILWLVGITNAFNLLDGADGVAAGSAFFSAAAIFLTSVLLGHPAIGLITAALAGALLGFLPFNFPPARAFLGDSGATLTGFLLAAVAVEASTKGATLVAIAVPLVAFAVPVFDTTITLLRRLVRGKPLFQPDRDHVHHRLARAGLSPRQVAGVIYAASAAFALAAMLFVNPGERTIALAFAVIGGSVWMVSRFLRLHELNELGRLAKRGALQPRAIALNVELRRASERLEEASSLDDLHQALAILLSRSEFDEVVLIVAPATDRRGTARSWRLANGRFVEEWSRRDRDEWEVVCPFYGDGWNGELHLRRRLGRRSLLLDINLLLELVQPALSRAAARIDVSKVGSS
jgi:UDP-GlcNAc:undecaprenyl-phosphate GlcNAc-1-phosphate transferase